MYQIPLFPLHTVLFPHTPISLHIFEPRYREMIAFCLAAQKPFGVVLIRRGQEVGAQAEPYRIGCTARISQVDHLPGGELDLTALGDERFEILSLDGRSQPYLTAQVRDLPLEPPQSLDVLRGMREMSAWMDEYIRWMAVVSRGELDLREMELPEDALLRLHIAAALLQIPAVEKQPLLEAYSAAELMHRVQRLYRRECALLGGISPAREAAAARSAWLN
jgi:uncharacterized protein